MAKQLYEMLKQFLKESRHGGPQLFLELIGVMEYIQREVPDAYREALRRQNSIQEGNIKAVLGDCKPWLNPLVRRLDKWWQAQAAKERPPTMVKNEQYN